MKEFNPKLRPRLTRVRGDITDNEYGYHPLNYITKVDGLQEGSRVKVLSSPQGEGVKSIVKVEDTKTHKEFMVLVSDLTIIVGKET